MADLRNQLGDVLYLRDNIIHRTSRRMDLLRTRLYFIRTGIDQLTNIIRRAGAAAGQMAYFTCHDGKPFALLARPGRFNRGVQRQDIRLESDVVNQRGDGANALCAVGNVIHGFNHGIHRFTALRRRATGGNRQLIGGGCGF